MESSIREVIDFARRNGGIFTTGEALALGMTASTLRRRIADGVFVRHSPGVLALPGAPDTHILDVRVACRKLDAIVSHQSAAYVHDLDRPRQLKPTVTVQRNHTKELVGVTVHQLFDLEPAHVLDIDGITVTTPERTIVDLAAVLREGHLARILDHGLAAGTVDIRILHSLFATLGRRGKPGTAVLRRLLEVRGEGYIAPESELERRLLLIIDRAELPPPVRQYQAPWLRSLNGRVDLAYPDHRIIVEGDSRRWHISSEAFEIDRLRDNAAQLAGWRVLRFTWLEITENPERVVSTIRRALEVERI
jgi:hypothetical protein